MEVGCNMKFDALLINTITVRLLSNHSNVEKVTATVLKCSCNESYSQLKV